MNIDIEKEIVQSLSSLYPLQEFEEKAIQTILDALQSAEPKRGKWIYQNGMINCDQCLRAIRRIDHDGLLNFCPNCGADMRGEQDG